MTERFRFITDPPSSGAYNMGVDWALLQSSDEGSSAPTLRLYGWRSPTLSVGYAQKTDDLDVQFMEIAKIPMVRRPTGGRALLHGDELTYALVIPATSRFHGNLRQVYDFATTAISKAFVALKVPVDSEQGRGGGASHTPCCFATSTRHEVSVNGVKVLGSAQRRLKNASLQHGSIMLSQDADRYLSCFIWDDAKQKERVHQSLGGINDLVQRKIVASDLRDAMVRSFTELYEIEFYEDQLTDKELATAKTFAEKADVKPEPSCAPVL